MILEPNIVAVKNILKYRRLYSRYSSKVYNYKIRNDGGHCGWSFKAYFANPVVVFRKNRETSLLHQGCLEKMLPESW